MPDASDASAEEVGLLRELEEIQRRLDAFHEPRSVVLTPEWVAEGTKLYDELRRIENALQENWQRKQQTR